MPCTSRATLRTTPATAQQPSEEQGPGEAFAGREGTAGGHGGSPQEPVPASATETPEGAAYWTLAPRCLADPESVEAVSRSRLDPSWASVRFSPEGESNPSSSSPSAARRKWEAKKSLRADEADYAKNEVVPLSEVPKDLLQYLYPENAFVADVPEPKQEKVDELPEAGPATSRRRSQSPRACPTPSASASKALEEAAGRIEDYDGVAGVHVRDLEGDFGYGVRPDEEFLPPRSSRCP